MNYIKKIGMSFIYIIVSILVLTLFITIFNYFNLISDKIVSIFKIIIPVIGMLIGGFYIGKKSSKKGFIEGLKMSLIFIVVLTIFNYLAFDYSFKFKYLLFYIILVTSSILGSMIGINKKR